jgi:hypothetical protein
MIDFRDELPVADIHVGPTHYVRIYGHADLGVPAVEVRRCERGMDDVLMLTVDQALAIAAALMKAAAKASR